MIILTRLGGSELALNPDLIERAEATPDTVITLQDGHKLVVAESIAQVVARVRTWRAEVYAASYQFICADNSSTWQDDESDGARGRLHDVSEASPTGSTAEVIGLVTALPQGGGRVVRMPRREN